MPYISLVTADILATLQPQLDVDADPEVIATPILDGLHEDVDVADLGAAQVDRRPRIPGRERGRADIPAATGPPGRTTSVRDSTGEVSESWEGPFQTGDSR